MNNQPATTRKYISIGDIQREYLPMSMKRLRMMVKKNLVVKIIGNRIFVDRAEFEDFLKSKEINSKAQNDEK